MTCIVFGPYAIDESVIVSGPPDAEAQVYAGGTTYATGDEVWHDGHAWRSKVDSNTGNTPVDGTNWKDLGEVDFGASAHSGTYDTGEYAVLNHRVWRSATDGNTDTPASGVTSWQDYGPTNRYKAFDQNLARFSASVGSLKWVLNFPRRALQCLAFLPVGENFNLTKTSDSTEIYENDAALVKDSGGAYYNYFFAQRETRANVISEDMPAILGEEITVEITSGEDSPVSVAGLLFGYGFEVDPVVTGSGFSGRGFVQIEFDEFGNFITPPRPKQKVTRFNTRPKIERSQVIEAEMNALMQQPAVAFMREGEDYGLMSYGVLDAYDLEMPNSVLTELVVKIQGFPR